MGFDWFCNLLPSTEQWCGFCKTGGMYRHTLYSVYSIVLQREVQLVEEASMKRQYCEEVATALHGESRPLQPKLLRFQNL